MGVPKLYRWLSKRYPEINQQAQEEKPQYIGEKKIPVDLLQKGPNDVKFDNLYLDMNGIIHPCSHPENKTAPKNQDEMFREIFIYIDRILSITRPKKLIYMAIDGVAPRAKMNQQRSRRFRSAKDAIYDAEQVELVKNQLRAQGIEVPENKAEEKFDSNCITPGTEFMDALSIALKFYICNRFTSNPAWKDLTVILSDSNVPGEGEHKIMEFIRLQRAQPNYNPNVRHVLHGADADLIMLGLATHEAHFTILREEFKPNDAKPCKICKRYGHEFQKCTGDFAVHETKIQTPSEYDSVSFVFIKLYVLRAYLKEVFSRCSGFNFERMIDDWIFICFFVGNDFLPNLPSLDINENAIDKLVRYYLDELSISHTFLTDSGLVNFTAVSAIMQAIGKEEDIIFKTRFQRDFRYQRKKYDEEMQMNATNASRSFQNSFQQNVPPNMKLEDFLQGSNASSHSVAANLNTTNGSELDDSQLMNDSQANNGEFVYNSHGDSIILHEDGWKSRYYNQKFGVVEEKHAELVTDVVYQYCRGLSWVLQYYFRGCPSWKWFYPYHYAPFASDFLHVDKVSNRFEKNTKPFKPVEQLMAVFPAESRFFLPKEYQKLLIDDESPIIHFYPSEFKTDLNGKKWAWQGVTLLPFISENELLAETQKLEHTLTEDEKRRNRVGQVDVFAFKGSPLGELIQNVCHKNKKMESDFKKEHWIRGSFFPLENCVPESDYESPVSDLSKIVHNLGVSSEFLNPDLPQGFLYKAKILHGAELPAVTLVKNNPKNYNYKRNNNGHQNGSFNRSYESNNASFDHNHSYNSNNSVNSFNSSYHSHYNNSYYDNSNNPYSKRPKHG